MARSRPVLLLSLLGIAGCAATPPELQSIRVVRDMTLVGACSFVGQVEGSSAWGGMVAQGLAHDNAMNEMRQKAKAVGANTLYLVQDRVGFSGARMLGDAYACPTAR